MKEYITVRCNGETVVYRRETIKRVKFDGEDNISITWATESDGYTDNYYPNSNAKQFFKRLMRDLGADEDTNKAKEI